MDRAAENAPPRYNLGYVWLISLIAAMGGLLFGYDWVVIGGIDTMIKTSTSVDPEERLKIEDKFNYLGKPLSTCHECLWFRNGSKTLN